MDGALTEVWRWTRNFYGNLFDIWGGQSGAQSEAAMTKIAERYPDLKEVLESRYVDDLATSVQKVKEA